MKQFFKSIVVYCLTKQVNKLRKKNEFKVVAVVGSIGKTSTKLAIAQTLGISLRVNYQQGNYNDIVSVPLIFFDQEMPSLLNPFKWIGIFIENIKKIKNYPYDVVVLELGTDSPGQIEAFSRYGKVDIVVITSIAPEHMENFNDLDAVAKEELSVVNYSDLVIYNLDLIDQKYIQMLPESAISYSINNLESVYHLANIFHSANGLEGDIKYQGDIILHINHEVVSEIQLYSVLASVVVGNSLGLMKVQIKEGINNIKPVPGRLRRLRGVNNSIIIDDSYNSSPEAVKAVLSTLKSIEAPQKIAVLGNMNELGSISEEAHKSIGDLCDPSFLSMVVTIGPEANSYLATAAEARGCNVRRFEDPYSIGDFLQTIIEPGAVILIKGSQNGVFAEESIKKILADPEDSAKLVRQSEYWLKLKAKQFKGK